MKQLLIFLSFSLGLSTVAQAGFVNNKSTWDSMSLEVKYGYVMGMYDDLVAVYKTGCNLIHGVSGPVCWKWL